MSDRDELLLALTQARAAYRLLHGYQTRVNDIFREIEGGLRPTGLTFSGWGSAFFRSPRAKGSPPWDGRWAWDLLPGYGMSAHFEGHVRASGLHARVVVQTIVDSGYAPGGGEPDPGTFEPVEQSQSVFQLSVMRAEKQVPNYAAVAPKMEEFSGNLYDGAEHWLPVGDLSVGYRWFDTELVDLATREKLRLVVVEPLRGWLALRPAQRG